MGMQQQLHHVLHEMSWYQVTLTLTSERMEGPKPRTFSWTWNILKLSQMLILPRRESVNRLDLLDLPHALPHQASRPMPAGDPPWVSGHVPSRYDMIYLDIFHVTTEIPGNQWQCSLGIMKSCISLVESSFFKTHQKSWNASRTIHFQDSLVKEKAQKSLHSILVKLASHLLFSLSTNLTHLHALCSTKIVSQFWSSLPKLPP